MKEKEQNLDLHECERCALHRVVLTEAKPTPEDASVFERIVTMINNTDQILKTPAPESFSDKDRQAFFAAAIDKNNDARALLSEWWTEARHKYGIPEYSRFDAYNCIFYYCAKPDGTPDPTSDFVPLDGEEDCDCDNNGCCSCK